MTQAKTVPTWIYHPGEEPKIVDLPEGARPPSGWSFSPADLTQATPEKENPATDDRGSVIADLEELGVDFDRRWGLKRLLDRREEALS